MTSISSLPEFGPEAKNTAGSPGSTRISRKVKTSTPKSAGSEDRKRLPARINVAPKAAIYADRLLATEIAIIDLAVELVGVAFERGRHHRVLAGLPERYLRYLAEMDGVELLAVFLVLGLVGFETGLLRNRHQFWIVDRRIVPALIACVEIAVEIVGRGQPGNDALGEEGKLLLIDLRRHLRIRQLLDIDLNADLGEGFLHQRRHRFGGRSLADIEAKRGREAVRHPRRLQIVFGLLEVELQRLRNRIGAARWLGIRPCCAEQWRPAAEKRRLEHVVVGQRKGDGATHVDVVEGRQLIVHRNEGDGIILWRGYHLQLALCLERLDVT